MKKLLCFVMFFAVSAVFSSAEDIKNNIKMVTYFPVPYVAYSTVQVDTAGQLDVGLTQAPAMYLGSTGKVPLNAKEAVVNLKTGDLKLDKIKNILGGNILILGAPGSEPSAGKLTFSKNLRINTMEAGSLVAEKPHSASDEIPFAMTVNSLSLFGKDFPACEGEEMVWQNLKLEEATQQETYLMCGTPSTPSVCQPTNNGKESYEESCTMEDGSTGKRTQTWSYSACTYIPGVCKPNFKKCLTNLRCTGMTQTTNRFAQDYACSLKSNNPSDMGCVKDCSDNLPMPHRYYNQVTKTDLVSNGFEGYLSDAEVKDCPLGGECDTCIPGKKYARDDRSAGFSGVSCYNGNPMIIHRSVIYYAQCNTISVLNDCEDLGDVTPQDCYYWSDVVGGAGGSGTGFIPNDGGGVAVAP